jgi:hypothetical protein
MTKPLSPTQAQILTTATQHPDRLAEPPANLPAAARNAVFQSMLRAGLLEDASGEEGIVLGITEAGLAEAGAVGATELAGEAVAGAQEGSEGELPGIATKDTPERPTPTAAPQPRISLREAASGLLVAWDAGLERPALPASMEALRAALGRRIGQGRAGRDPAAPRTSRHGTKQQAVLTLLRRPAGATIAQVIEATGWAQHTVRDFLPGLKKKGYRVEVLERVRQVGPGAQGVKGSYSVYRVGAEEQG